MSQHMRSVSAAVKRAAAAATDTTPTFAIGEVTAWTSPRATVNIGSSSIPKIRATQQAAASITVGSTVLVMVHGSLAVIIGTI